MKLVSKAISFVLLLTFASFANAMQVTFQQLQQNAEAGCPSAWHDPTVVISESVISDPTPTVTDLLPLGSDDRQKFIDIYHLTHDEVGDPITNSEMDTVLADKEFIAFECNSHRKVLLEAMLTTNELDTQAVLDAAIGLAEAIDLSSRHWLTGNIRFTGQTLPEPGWIFPIGQTIGADGSGADLTGDKYEYLFEEAKTWPNAQATGEWAAGGVVRLPDMRGRALFASNTMSDQLVSVSPSTTLDVASLVGKSVGGKDISLTTANMPAHNHGMNSVPNHTHGVSNKWHNHTTGNKAHAHSTQSAGNHQHNSKQALYSPGNYGWGTFSNRWPTGGIRPDSDGGNSATLTNAILAKGSHTHSIPSTTGSHNHSVGGNTHNHTTVGNGGHQHPIHNTGGGQALEKVSPGLVMNVEMKL